MRNMLNVLSMNKRLPSIKVVSVLLLVLVITACGFRLRGALDIPDELKSIYISSEKASPDFTSLLKRNLKLNGVRIADSASDAALALHIYEERVRRRTLTITESAKTAEYQLNMDVSFDIQSPTGDTLLEKDIVSNEKIYLEDTDSVASVKNEETLLKKEMRLDLIKQIVRRIQAVAEKHLKATPTRISSTQPQT